MTAHLRMNAVYWGLTALCVMNRKDALDREDMISYVMSCWDDEAGQVCFLQVNASMLERVVLTPRGLGAFGAHPDHDAHLLSTLSAIQILIMQDALDRLDIPRVVKCTCVLRRHVCDVLTCKNRQTFFRSSSLRGFSLEMLLARSMRVSCTVRSTRCPCSVTCMSWTWKKLLGTSDSAETLMADLVHGRGPKVMQPWVCPILRPYFSALILMDRQCLYV